MRSRYSTFSFTEIKNGNVRITTEQGTSMIHAFYNWLYFVKLASDPRFPAVRAEQIKSRFLFGVWQLDLPEHDFRLVITRVEYIPRRKKVKKAA